MAVQMLEKTMKTIKEAQDEEAKKKMPKSIEIVSEDVKDTKATVKVKVTNEGGEVSESEVECEQIDGAWKMTKYDGLQPKTEGGADLGDAIESAGEEVGQALENAGEEVEEAAEEAAEEVAEAAEEATEE